MTKNEPAGYLLTIESRDWKDGQWFTARRNVWTRSKPMAWLAVAMTSEPVGVTITILAVHELDDTDWRASAMFRTGEPPSPPPSPFVAINHDIMATAATWVRSPVATRERRPVIYLAHPVGADTCDGIALNVARARRWLRALMDAYPDVAWLCPWLPFLDVGENSDIAYRARCLLDDVVIATRADGIVLCGTEPGAATPGMALEREAVIGVGGVVLDLTLLGTEPPRPWTCAIDVAATVPGRRRSS